MKTPSGLSTLLSSECPRLPVRPLLSQPRVLRFGCAAAAGSLYGAGMIKMRRPQRISAQGPRHSSLLPQGFGSEERRVTDSLLVFNTVMFAAQFLSKEALTVWGIKSNTAIAAGQWWRLITPSFLHGSVIHLIINSMALNSLGPTVETISGRPRFLAAYSTAAVAGVTASYFCSPRLSLGSSGAIFGIGGALAMFLYRHRDAFGQGGNDMLQQLGRNLAINVVYGLIMPNVDNWAHMGGLVGGALAAYLLGPHFVSSRPPGSHRPVYVDSPPVPILAYKTSASSRLAGPR